MTARKNSQPKKASKKKARPKKGTRKMSNVVLSHYADVQQYLIQILTGNISSQTGDNEEADSEGAPHGAFWADMSYDQFVNGNVPGVSDPNTGQPMKILEIGNAANSNIINALLGTPGTPFDPGTGAFGQMPADGPPFLTQEQVQPIADWIDNKCPQ